MAAAHPTLNSPLDKVGTLAIMLGEIIGPDILIILAVVLVLFGGSQLPKLARGLGSAQKEFKKGLEEGHVDDDDKNKSDNKKTSKSD